MIDLTTTPADLEAERGLLAACMLHPAAAALSSDLDPLDMYDPRHRHMLAAAQTLFNRGERVDSIALNSQMKHTGTDGGIDGFKYTINIMSEVGSHFAVPSYMTSIRRYARLRRAAALASQGVQHLSAGNLGQAEDALGRCAGAVAFTDGRFQVERLDGACERVVDALRDAQRTKTVRVGLRTGFRAIDGVQFGARGFHRGEMIILAARPAMGKSALALNKALNIARTGEPVVYACSEMSINDMATRLIAYAAEVDYARLKAGTSSDQEHADINAAVAEIEGLPLYLYDKGSVTVPDLLAKVREVAVKAGRPVAMLVVDHINRMSCEVKYKGENAEFARVSHNYEALQAVAFNEHICCLVLAQLNRGLESRGNKRPLMSDLRASGRAEEEAAVVLCLYRDHVYNPETASETSAELIYRKHRGGKLGTIDLEWRGDMQRFSDGAARCDQYQH